MIFKNQRLKFLKLLRKAASKLRFFVITIAKKKNYFKNWFFKLMFKRCFFSIWRRRNTSFDNFLQQKNDFRRMQLWDLRQKIVNYYSLFETLTIETRKHRRINWNLHRSQKFENFHNFQKIHFSTNSLNRIVRRLQHSHSKIKNVKIDALTRMFDFRFDENDDKQRYKNIFFFSKDYNYVLSMW